MEGEAGDMSAQEDYSRLEAWADSVHYVGVGGGNQWDDDETLAAEWWDTPETQDDPDDEEDEDNVSSDTSKRFAEVLGKGGPGSGNFGHAGRPGEVGGSGPGGATGEVNPKVEAWARQRFGSEEKAQAFTKWFGQSKVVDENGEPLVVYHGNRGESFNEFDASKNREPPMPNGLKPWFFANDETIAGSYGPNIQSFYLRMDNVLDVTEVPVWNKETAERDSMFVRSGDYRRFPYSLRKELEQDGVKGETDTQHILDWMDSKGIAYAKWNYANAMKKFGTKYDGIIARNTLDTFGSETRGDIYIAFRPTQIKSTNNRGTFSPDSSDIRKSIKQGWSDAPLTEGIESKEADTE